MVWYVIMYVGWIGNKLGEYLTAQKLTWQFAESRMENRADLQAHVTILSHHYHSIHIHIFIGCCYDDDI